MSYLAEQCFPYESVCSYRDVVSILSKLSVKGFFNEFKRSEVSPVEIDETGLGIAYTEITAFKKGVVLFSDRLWVALSNGNVVIYPGEKVRVTGLKGHTLLVEKYQDK